MTRTFEVVLEDKLDGLEVIGFHGEVDPAHTPGRREPVLIDELGRLVGLEVMEPRQADDTRQRVLVRAGQRLSAGPLPRVATRLEQHWVAQWGYIIVVLGKQEQVYARVLSTVEPRVEEPAVDRLTQWLASGTADAPPSLRVQRIGELVAWYCGPTQAFALYQRIARVAEKEMFRAFNAGEDGALYRASWWLARAALDDAGRFLAAVGLERSNPGIADAYVKSTFRKKSAEEIEAALAHGRGVFSDCCTAERQQSVIQDITIQGTALADTFRAIRAPDIGDLSRARRTVRQHFKVPQKQAA